MSESDYCKNGQPLDPFRSQSFRNYSSQNKHQEINDIDFLKAKHQEFRRRKTIARSSGRKQSDNLDVNQETITTGL